MIDPNLRGYARSVRQLEFFDAVEKHGTVRAAEKALGTANDVIGRSMRALKAHAAQMGYSPEHDLTHAVPEGFKLKGASTYYDKDGKKAGQWVKTTADAEAQAEMLRAGFAAMSEELPRIAPTDAPRATLDALCNLYTLTDCHVGALAWGKETGADWDLDIAEKTLIGAFAQMVHSSPSAGTAIVNQLGDFLHSDGIMAMTPTSGHLLDVDGRFAKVVTVAIRILRTVIGLALERHNKVVVLMAQGNHDLTSSIWLRVMFKALYENEPRVQVIDSELPYYVYQHGQTMLGFHHGHKKPMDQLPMLFAAQYPKVWGDTTKRYAHMGHQHHVHEKEYSGMLITQHSTLAARDSYAAQGGWLSERQVTAITYHSTWGQVARNTVTPEMLT
jgi:hypothetical protein